MRPIEKLRSDLSRSAAELAKATEAQKTAVSRQIVDRFFGGYASLKEPLHRNFEELRLADTARAFEWLACVGGILARDFDDSPLDIDGWERIRDVMNEISGDLDMDTLTYAMTLVVDHRAL